MGALPSWLLSWFPSQLRDAAGAFGGAAGCPFLIVDWFYPMTCRFVDATVRPSSLRSNFDCMARLGVTAGRVTSGE
jgi:hypothetical protein